MQSDCHKCLKSEINHIAVCINARHSQTIEIQERSTQQSGKSFVQDFPYGRNRTTVRAFEPALRSQSCEEFFELHHFEERLQISLRRFDFLRSAQSHRLERWEDIRRPEFRHSAPGRERAAQSPKTAQRCRHQPRRKERMTLPA